MTRRGGFEGQSRKPRWVRMEHHLCPQAVPVEAWPGGTASREKHLFQPLACSLGNLSQAVSPILQGPKRNELKSTSHASKSHCDIIFMDHTPQEAIVASPVLAWASSREVHCTSISSRSFATAASWIEPSPHLGLFPSLKERGNCSSP